MKVPLYFYGLLGLAIAKAMYPKPAPAPRYEIRVKGIELEKLFSILDTNGVTHDFSSTQSQTYIIWSPFSEESREATFSELKPYLVSSKRIS